MIHSDDQEGIEQKPEKVKYVSYLKIFMDYRIILNFLTVFLPAVSYTVLAPSYAIYLKESLEISPAGTGYIIGLQAIANILFCPIIGWSCQKVNRRLILFVSTILVSLSTIIIGKEDYLGLPNSLKI